MRKIDQIQVKYLWKDYFRGGGGIREGDDVEEEGLASRKLRREILWCRK